MITKQALRRAALCAALVAPVPAMSQDDYYDAHVHLTNYVQEGISASAYLDVVGERVQRSVLFLSLIHI
mgnify:FL=1